MNYKSILSVAMTTSVFLVGCGGGSSDSNVTTTANPTPVAAVQKYPLNAAQQSILTNGINLRSTAIDGTDKYDLTLAMSPSADEIFENVLRKKANLSITIKLNGVIGAVDNSSAYFSVNPLTSVGGRFSDGSYMVLTSNASVLPVSAAVGEFGGLGNYTTYNSNKSVKETTQSSWSVEPDTATTAFSCVNDVTKNAAGIQTGVASGCYKLDSNGNINGMRFTTTIAGKTLVFK